MTHMNSCTAWEACEAIREVGCATIHHSKGWGGTAVATMVQGPQQFTADPHKFHLLEMTLSGTLDGHNHFDGLLGGGDAFYRPNSLFYVPQGRSVVAGAHAGSADLMRLSADARSRAKPLPRSMLADRDTARTVDQIEANLGNALSLRDLAGELGMSVYAFSRAFKTNSGMAPHRYLTQRRIERVKTRLAQTNDSLAGIAYEAGFSSQAYMTTAFKKIVGTTPGPYRWALRA